MSLTVDAGSHQFSAAETGLAHDTGSRRPEVLRRDGQRSRGRVIDLRRPAPEARPAILPQSSRVTVLRDRRPRTQRTRVFCGRDAESPLLWQRIAEAVLAAGPGDTVAVDVSELPELSSDFVDYLRYADYRLSRRGGIFLLDPSSDAVFTHVRFGA